MNPRFRLLLAFLALLALVGGLLGVVFRPAERPPMANRVSATRRSSTTARQAEISALGYLVPAGDVRVLASPSQNVDGNPRLKSLNVEEGDPIRRGQVLAVFDSIDRLQAQRNRVETKVASITAQLKVLESETSRYRNLEDKDVVSKADLESRELQVLQLKAELRQAVAELQQIETEESYAHLRSPIDGYVIKINARPGEMSGMRGVMEVGALQNMEAIAQVDEDNIQKISLGQRVRITSENDSFNGTIKGSVIRIAKKVSRRRILNRDPAADSDTEARTIDVRIAIDPESTSVVKNLSGIKVNIVFERAANK